MDAAGTLVEVLKGEGPRGAGHAGEAARELHTAVTLAPSEVEQRLLQGPLRAVRSELG
jgi:hypothetical protein